MGCSQSKMEKEEAVTRCKDCNHFIKQAVSGRNAFAATHSSYATYLKNAGAALVDFAQGQVQNPQFPSSSSSVVVAQPSYEIPLPPPPLPDFPAPLCRFTTMPEINSARPEPDSVGTIIEEKEEDVEEEVGPPPPSKQPSGSENYRVEEQNSAWEYLFPSVENMHGITLKGDVEEVFGVR